MRSTCFISLILVCFSSCYLGQTQINGQQGLIHFRTYIFSSDMSPWFVDTARIWYSDSTTIEELHVVNQVTDTANITTITYPVFLHRYIDLHSMNWYTYKTFSDTAKIVDKGRVTDSTFNKGGWNFVSEKHQVVEGTPQMLNDTLVDGVHYKRAKLRFKKYNTQASFKVCYFRCDGTGLLFSLEKSLSRKLNCTMTKIFSYKVNSPNPYATQQVDFPRNHLTAEEKKVFAAWAKNAKEYPVL